MKSRLLKKVLCNICVALLILVYFCNGLAGQFSGQINGFLGTSTTKIEYIDGGEGSNEYTRYYDSVYNSVAELKAAGLAKAEEVEAEGAVLLMNNGLLPLVPGTRICPFGNGIGNFDDFSLYPFAVAFQGVAVGAFQMHFIGNDVAGGAAVEGLGINTVFIICAGVLLAGGTVAAGVICFQNKDFSNNKEC